MTNRIDHHETSTGAARPRGAHIVDVVQGPLVGEGRLQRTLPFAMTAATGLAIALPRSSWARPGLAVAGSIVFATTIVLSVAFPWWRLPRLAQLAAPYLALIATLMLSTATGAGIGSAFVTMSVLPLMWLAIYESRTAVLVAAAVAGATLWLAAPTGEPVPTTSGLVNTVVFTICCVGMAVTLQGVVAEARTSALALRQQQITLEHSAAVLDALPERVNRYRISDHVITYCNSAWATQYNLEPETAIGRPLEEFLSASEMAGLRSQLPLLTPENPILIDTEARAVSDRPDGPWLEWIDRYLPGANGAEVLSIGRDVTRRRQAEQRLAESEAEFRDLADKSVDVVWRLSFKPTPHFVYMSPSIEATIGYSPSYFLEDFSRIFDVLDDEGVTTISRALNGEKLPDHFDFRYRHANGSIVVGETRTALVRGGLQGVSRDVTELRRLQDNLAALALRDPLTGLANRRLFNELLDASLAHHQRNGTTLALAFLDLDGMKHVNDVYGHDAGDVVLRATANRLVEAVRGADTVARIGGDEFVIVFEPNDANSYNLIARIDRALAEPIEITETTSVLCPASIGVAHTSTVGYASAVLLAAADDAMYETKRTRRGMRVAELL